MHPGGAGVACGIWMPEGRKGLARHGERQKSGLTPEERAWRRREQRCKRRGSLGAEQRDWPGAGAPTCQSCREGNGYIEGKELENFFQELESARKGAGVESRNTEFAGKMQEFMRKYDKNADGKIEMSELAQILPTEENFLLCFRQHVSSSTEFMEAWRKYDTDRSGYIEANELKGFLSDLLEKANRPYDEPKLQEYTQTILRMFDLNGDGKLCLSEMSRLLPVQENFLLKFQGMKLDAEEFNAIFAFYDKDGNGFIDENELDALLKDLYEKNQKEMGIQQLTNYRKSIMNLSDGGKLYRKELEIVLCSETPL
uniref:Calretinin n=1 Tax=Pogona vitticeps TaxID=103695 RepID=A0ABM5EUE0_9SAUR